MLPKAYIVHQTRSRVRLRIPEMRQQVEFFGQAYHQIAAIDGVSDVSVNQLTGSIMLLHPEQAFMELKPELQALELFELVMSPPPVTPAREVLYSGVTELDRMINKGSLGGMDLGMLSFSAVLGTAIHQIAKGNYTGPGIPLLISSIGLLRKAAEQDKEPDK